MSVGDDIAVAAQDDARALSLLTAKNALVALDIGHDSDNRRLNLFCSLGDGQLALRKIQRLRGGAVGVWLIVEGQLGTAAVLCIGGRAFRLFFGCLLLGRLLSVDQCIHSVACQTYDACAQDCTHDDGKDAQSLVLSLFIFSGLLWLALLIILIIPFVAFACLWVACLLISSVWVALRCALLVLVWVVAVAAIIACVLALTCFGILLRSGAVPALFIWLAGLACALAGIGFAMEERLVVRFLLLLIFCIFIGEHPAAARCFLMFGCIRILSCLLVFLSLFRVFKTAGIFLFIHIKASLYAYIHLRPIVVVRIFITVSIIVSNYEDK